MAPTPSQAPSRDGTIVAEIVSRIETTMAEHRLPGFAIGIVRAGQVIYAQGFGKADLDTGKPVTSASVFNVASVSKTFTAVATMQLVEQGKIDLDARLTTYLPYFRLEDPRYADITIRHLLAHISGLPNYVVETVPYWKADEFDHPDRDDGALERGVRNLSSVRLLADPGGPKLLYSSVGYDCLGDVIAKVSGQSYEDYMGQNIFAPLAMKHSTFLLDEVDSGLLTRGYQRDEATGEVTAWPFYPFNRRNSPGGGLFTSIDDLNQAALALLNDGEWHGKQILQATKSCCHVVACLGDGLEQHRPPLRSGVDCRGGGRASFRLAYGHHLRLSGEFHAGAGRCAGCKHHRQLIQRISERSGLLCDEYRDRGDEAAVRYRRITRTETPYGQIRRIQAVRSKHSIPDRAPSERHPGISGRQHGHICCVWLLRQGRCSERMVAALCQSSFGACGN